MILDKKILAAGVDINGEVQLVTLTSTQSGVAAKVVGLEVFQLYGVNSAGVVIPLRLQADGSLVG